MAFTNAGPSTTSTNNTSIGYGNAAFTLLMQATLSPVSVAANTTAEQTFTVTGLSVGDMLAGVNKPTTQAGLGIVGMRVSAANTIAITFGNFTGSPIVPTASEVYFLEVLRPMPQYVGALPTSLPI